MTRREPVRGRYDRRRLLAMGSGLALLARPAGARAQEATPGAASPMPDGGEWTFTDDRGITVTLPARPERVVAQVGAAAALWDYGVRPIGIFGPSRREDGTQDPQSGRVDLDEVVSIGQIWGEFDLEAFIALDPDLLVSWYYSSPTPLWYVPEEVEDIVEAQVPTIGFQVVELPITHPIARFAELAGALGANLEAPENAAAKAEFLAAEADLKAAIAEKPGLSVIAVAGGEEALYVANPTIADDLVYFRELGLDLVDVEGDEFWDTLSWEQANKYPVDLILNDARSQSLTPEQLAEIETWRALPAVVAGQVAPWHAEPIYSYHGYAPVLRELAEVIRNADPDIVP